MGGSEECLTGHGDGPKMGHGEEREEGQEGGGSWVIPGFQLAQLSGRVRGGTLGRGQVQSGQDHESESGHVESGEPQGHRRGGLK